MKNKAVLFISLLILFSACAGQVKKKVTLKCSKIKAMLATGIMHRKLQYKAKLISGDKKTALITSRLGSFRVISISSNKTQVDITSKNETYGRALSSFITQTSCRQLGFNRKSKHTIKPLMSVFSLHLLSPAFSSMYKGYNNPFSGKDKIWQNFLLHLGIDGAGIMLAGTEGFSKDFKFNVLTAAFLLLHRAITLPSVIIETDIFNSAVRAGYQLKF